MSRRKEIASAIGAVAVLLLFAAQAQGLDPRIALTQYGHTAWRARDGHFSGAPNTIAQTRDGYLWIGTEAGIVRFDGVQFEPWKPSGGVLPDERIISLLGASDGSLWIGTATGLAQWKDGKLFVHTTLGRFDALLEDRRGTIWAGHTRSLSRLPPLCRMERGVFQCFEPVQEFPLHFIGALHEDRRGDLWFGGGPGVCRWRSGHGECFPIEGLAELKDKTGVFALGTDEAGRTWAGAGTTGVWRLEAGAWKSFSISPAVTIESEAMLTDREGNLWIGSVNAGLIRLVKGRTETFTQADGLSSDQVMDLFEDREGNVWVATPSGIDRFRDMKVATLTRREGLGLGRVLAVTPARDGGLWISDRSSLIHWKDGKLSVEGREEGLPGAGPTSLLEDSRGRLWVAIDNELAYRDNGRFVTVKLPDGSNVGIVVSMVEDRSGDILAATIKPDHLLVRIRGDRVVEVISKDRLDGDWVTGMVANPKGGVWLSQDLKLQLYKDGAFETISPAPATEEVHVRDMFSDARGLWLSTSRGLMRYRNGKFDTLGLENGLPCVDIETAIRSQDGSLWLKTACGLIRIASSEWNAWSDQPRRRVRIHFLDAFDGAQAGLTPFHPRSAMTADGRLWFAIENGGLQMIDPAHVSSNTVPPPVQISRVVADRRIYGVAGLLRFPPRTKDVEIDYTALSHTIPEKVRFRYRLEGADSEWRAVGTRRQAFFANLKPGTYRFHVLACNNDGVWSPAGAAVRFVIPPSFSQTRGFLVLCVVLTASLAALVYRWRVRQVRATLQRAFDERLAERTRIARELHDTLLQGFLSSSMQLHVAVDELPESARGRFQRVQELMEHVIDEGRRVLRGLRSSVQVSDDLEQALSRVPGELEMQSSAKLSIVADGEARVLRPIVRDEVYRIAREALVNALRHAQARVIEVELDYGTNDLRVSVHDDGRGIDPDVLRSGREGHWGLSGMRERAGKIGGKLRLWSHPDGGTDVELSIPGELAYADPARPTRWWERSRSKRQREDEVEI